jgi:hypothetical protein
MVGDWLTERGVAPALIGIGISVAALVFPWSKDCYFCDSANAFKALPGFPGAWVIPLIIAGLMTIAVVNSTVTYSLRRFTCMAGGVGEAVFAFWALSSVNNPEAGPSVLLIGGVVALVGGLLMPREGEYEGGPDDQSPPPARRK